MKTDLPTRIQESQARAARSYVALKPFSLYEHALQPGDTVPREALDRLPFGKLPTLIRRGFVATPAAAKAASEDRQKRSWGAPPEANPVPGAATPSFEEATDELATLLLQYDRLDFERNAGPQRDTVRQDTNAEAKFWAVSKRIDLLKRVIAEHQRQDAILASQAASSPVTEPPTLDQRMARLEATVNRLAES